MNKGVIIETKQRFCACCLLAFVVFVLPGQALTNPLFESDEPLAITLEMPLRKIIREADKNPLVDGALYVKGNEGPDVRIDMTMTTRGRSRLIYCKFPPLKTNLVRSQLKGTVLEGQNKLKIVTHCRNGHMHHRYLQQEFAIYKAYNELTDFSYRVRWLTVTYRDSTGKRKDEVHDAFFIESTGEVAERLGRERVIQHRIASGRLNPIESSRYALFQYMIANTDWSMTTGTGDEGCCHNGKVLIEPGSTANWTVIPYDFDQAGLINTKYAAPAQGLNIRTVRQRLFRGRCRHNDQIAATIELFNARRERMKAHFLNNAIARAEQKRALKYIDDFYKIINDPKKRQAKILDSCIGA